MSRMNTTASRPETLIPSERIEWWRTTNLLGVIFAPSIEGMEELFAVHFKTINNCTSGSTDVHVRISSILEFLGEVRLSNHASNLLYRLGADQNLASIILADALKNIFGIAVSSLLLRGNQRQFACNNPGGTMKPPATKLGAATFTITLPYTETLFIPGFLMVAECLGVAVKK